MSRSSRVLLWVGLAVLIAALIAGATYWFQRNYHRVEQTLYLPPTGEAAYNPLYALKKTLEADGVRVDARQRLVLDRHPLAPRDTLLLYNDARVLTPSQSQQLLDWVAEGGHLLVRTPPPSRWGEKTSALLEALAIEPTDQSRCEPYLLEGEDSHVEFCRGRRFRMHDVEPELSWGDLQAGYVFARLTHGKGHVDVLADFEFMVNRESTNLFLGDMTQPPKGGLRDAPHQALARQLLAPNYGAGTIHLVYAAQMPSLMRTILFQGWLVWAPLLIALLAWLWSRMSRFGPQLPAPAMARRSLLEHVRASGDLLFRYGRGSLLYIAARHAFLARLRRRDPVAAALTGEPQIEAIAARLAWPAEGVRAALATPSTHDKAAFRDRISILIELRNRL